VKRHIIPPGELAKVDQIAAQLGEIVLATVEHMRSCPSVPAGVCIGKDAARRIADLGHPHVESLLEEAVSQLAQHALTAGGET
jgi:hypothetical protein